MISHDSACARWTSCSRALATLVLIVGLVTSSEQATAFEIDVWIDPGHGGIDIGTVGFDGDPIPNEKDITFPIADRVELKLFSLGFFCVYKTRNSDTDLSVEDRPLIASGQLANDQGLTATCRLFVSIHLDSGPESAFGTKTFYARSKPVAKNSKLPADASAADEIHADLLTYADDAFGPTCHRNRMVEKKNYYVLKNTTAPAVLIEVCFLTNECQYYQIIQTGWQNYLGDGIAAGISGYLNFSFCQPLGAEPLAVTPAALLTTFSASPQVQVAHTDGLAAAASVRTPLTALTEDFEGGAFPPAGWTKQTAGLAVPYNWHRTTDPDYVGAGSASAYVGSESPSAIDEWLVSPSVAISAPDDAIKFSWAGNKYWAGVVNAIAERAARGDNNVDAAVVPAG